MRACVPEVQFAGTYRDRQGTKPKAEAWDSLGGKFDMLICQRSSMLLCVEKANPPVSRWSG
jgi:hypothetical protein